MNRRHSDRHRKIPIIFLTLLIIAFIPFILQAETPAEDSITKADTSQTINTTSDSLTDTTHNAKTLSVGEQRRNGRAQFYNTQRTPVLIFMLVFSAAVLLYTKWAKKGKELFVRKIPGIVAVEEAVGRATEMGKPVLFVPGIGDITEIDTIAGLSILGRVARITAQYDTPLSVPVRYPMILAAGQEVVEQAYIAAGRHDAYDKDTVKYIAGEQFAFTASVNGWMMREKPATNIYMGAFYAESLLLAESGNAAGSIQIAGTAQPEQLPFFIAACDFTLMGEELFAASSYLSREPLLLGGLKGQDFVKIIIIICILAGMFLVTFNIGNWYLNWFNIP